MPELSVIVPTYNRRESLLRTLRALEGQTLDLSRFEVIVVSDGSSDGTSEAVSALKTPYALRFVDQKNAGPSRARNHGSELAHAELLVFVDDDIEPVKEFLAEHLAQHAKTQNLVVIGPQSGPFGEPMPPWIEWEHRMLQRQYDNFAAGVWEAGPNNLYSGNFSLPRAALLACGGFNEGFTRQEDVELGFRLERAGLKFTFCGSANGIHRSSRPFQSWRRTPYEYGRRDAQMAAEAEGGPEALAWARKNWAERNRITKLLAHVAIGRPVLEPALLGALDALVHCGVRRIALGACSLLFNLRYVQGMRHEAGSRSRLWGMLEPGAAQ